MFKAIATRMACGKYDDVGMNNRTVFDGSEGSIIRKAKAWARGANCRVEIFDRERFYSAPIKTIIV